MAEPRIQIPENVTVDRAKHRKTIFTTKKAKAIVWLAGSVREERLAAQYLRKEDRRPRGYLDSEVERAEDVIRLGAMLLTELAVQENAILGRYQGVGTEEEQQTGLIKRKRETAEALRTSRFGVLFSASMAGSDYRN